jgi:hypothetical protein
MIIKLAKNLLALLVIVVSVPVLAFLGWFAWALFSHYFGVAK